MCGWHEISESAIFYVEATAFLLVNTFQEHVLSVIALAACPSHWRGTDGHLWRSAQLPGVVARRTDGPICKRDDRGVVQGP